MKKLSRVKIIRAKIIRVKFIPCKNLIFCKRELFVQSRSLYNRHIFPSNF